MRGTGGLLAATTTAATATASPSASPAPPVTIGRDAAREAAAQELSKPMYHQNDPGLFQRALDWFWDKVGSLFDHASASTPGGALGLVAVAVFAVLVLAALWWRLGAPKRAAGAAGTLFDDGVRSAADHRTSAEALAAEGRWNEAVQERMRAVVRSLEERTLLDPRPGRTADEAATEAAVSLPAHEAALRAAARTFDEVTYGARPANGAMYATLRDLDLDLTRTKPLLTGPTP
ncbi:DUF4129 domain-containing protein [Streptomyces sp. NBC_00503]|uniref:DUF4129 domain-containing protein n=1 Tax=Streptomyces sp. NBC_00503 TaxID=2903659 RepID=UPI002E80CB30|nr:DUF4129 domain-containing protein [Streptomyces sp. NBC_00503]WUD81602.1 DUF4129 domain-containing protein [Streptomyces sp. NBC_00503]